MYNRDINFECLYYRFSVLNFKWKTQLNGGRHLLVANSSEFDKSEVLSAKIISIKLFHVGFV